MARKQTKTRQNGSLRPQPALSPQEMILSRLADRPLAQAVAALAVMLEEAETDADRFAILSARIAILRNRLVAVRSGQEISATTPVGQFIATAPAAASAAPAADPASEPEAEPAATTAAADRMVLRILQDCEHGGIFLPTGFRVEIDRGAAERLIQRGLAEQADAAA